MGTSGRPRAWLTASGTKAGSESVASSTQQPRSSNRSMTPRAASRARRVLPTPPGPVSVSRRAELSSLRTVERASFWPTKLVMGRGRFIGLLACPGRRPRPKPGGGVPSAFALLSGGGRSWSNLSSDKPPETAVSTCERTAVLSPSKRTVYLTSKAFQVKIALESWRMPGYMVQYARGVAWGWR
jgi:hypothetical protein